MLLQECFLASLYSENTISASHCIDQNFFRLFTQRQKKQVSEIARCGLYSLLLQVKAVISEVEIISLFYTVLTKYVHWLEIMQIAL